MTKHDEKVKKIRENARKRSEQERLKDLEVARKTFERVKARSKKLREEKENKDGRESV